MKPFSRFSFAKGKGSLPLVLSIPFVSIRGYDNLQLQPGVTHRQVYNYHVAEGQAQLPQSALLQRLLNVSEVLPSAQVSAQYKKPTELVMLDA